MDTDTREAICRHCDRRIVLDREDGWVDPEATGDDEMWRDSCDSHDTFIADHEPSVGISHHRPTPTLTDALEAAKGLVDDPRHNPQYQRGILELLIDLYAVDGGMDSRTDLAASMGWTFDPPPYD